MFLKFRIRIFREINFGKKSFLDNSGFEIRSQKIKLLRNCQFFIKLKAIPSKIVKMGIFAKTTQDLSNGNIFTMRFQTCKNTPTIQYFSFMCRPRNSCIGRHTCMLMHSVTLTNWQSLLNTVCTINHKIREKVVWVKTHCPHYPPYTCLTLCQCSHLCSRFGALLPQRKHTQKFSKVSKVQ